LEWLIEELVEDGDEIVCLRVVEKDSKIASDPSVQQETYKDEARALLQSVQKKNEDGKAISLVLELAVGKVPETIQRMVCQYCPLILFTSLPYLNLNLPFTSPHLLIPIQSYSLTSPHLSYPK